MVGGVLGMTAIIPVTVTMTITTIAKQNSLDLSMCPDCALALVAWIGAVIIRIGPGRGAAVWIGAGIARMRGVENTRSASTATMVMVETGHEA